MKDTSFERRGLAHITTIYNNMTPAQLARQRMATALKQHSMSQSELSDRSGIRQGTVSKIITGQRPVSVQQAGKFALIFGRTPAYWLGESEPVAQEPFIGGTVHPLTGRIV